MEVECNFCGTIKQSNPTPDGDEICPNCGGNDMWDVECESNFYDVEI